MLGVLAASGWLGSPHVSSKPEEPEGTSLSFCLFLDALPWSFGPYQQQGFLLAKGFSQLGHAVSWFATRGWTAAGGTDAAQESIFSSRAPAGRRRESTPTAS